MRTRTSILLTSTALAAGAVLPAQAAADKTFQGKTQQQRSVSLTTTDDDVLSTFRVNWIARSCNRGRRFQLITGFRPPFDEAVPGSFADAGSFTDRDAGGIRSRVTIAITGKHTPADPATPGAERWTGTVKARVVVRRNGRVIDRCRMSTKTWSAAAV